MNQNRLKCHCMWWKQFFYNWCQVFPLSISWMGLSWGQSAIKAEKHLLVLWRSYYPVYFTIISSIISKFSFSPLLQKPSRQEHKSLLTIVSQTIKSLLSFVSWLWGGVWALEDTSQNCQKAWKMQNSLLCISVSLLHHCRQPASSRGFSHICHNLQHQVLWMKVWFRSGKSSSKHSSVRTPVASLNSSQL